MRYRVLLEQLEELADQIGNGDLGQVDEPAYAYEKTVRLLAAALMLLRQHHVNKQGQCRCCGRTRLKWQLLTRRPRCTVYSAFGFAMEQGLDVVWWQVFARAGQCSSLEEVRVWLAKRTQDR